MTEIGPRDDTKLAAIKLEWWPRSDWNRWPPSSESAGWRASAFRGVTASLATVLGHADRVRPFADYCVGLLSAEGRKSVEPLAAVTAPERTAAQHQSLLHFVAQAPWSE